MSKSFENWKIGELMETFGLSRIYHSFTLLQIWLMAENEINAQEHKALDSLKEQLIRNAENWNEDELKFMFISPLILLADLQSEKCKIFTQRRISAEVQGIRLNGIVDFVLATGIDEPKKPFFFLHEYKQEKKRDNDPLAQLVAEMLAAQALNETPKPLFGCYVLGRFWFFVVLKDKNLEVSLAFDATQEDIFRIFKMLRWVKEQIES
ncbi:MAG: hypothetical protein NW226_13900 [Microscillaceae bacterium]|nr:hypothetical protein [Microscillaceae bacterium]